MSTESEARAVLQSIAAPVPAGMIGALEKKNNRTGASTSFPFIRWNVAAELMDERAPGWCSEIVRIHGETATASCTVRVTIPLPSGGAIWREATGTDDEPDSTYGEPLDRAEAAALKRAFAKFGLARRECYPDASGHRGPATPPPPPARKPTAAAARKVDTTRDIPPTPDEIADIAALGLDELRAAYAAATNAGRVTLAAQIKGMADTLKAKAAA